MLAIFISQKFFRWGFAPIPRKGLARRLAVGIKDNLIRFSIGIEDSDDLIADLEQGLEKI